MNKLLYFITGALAAMSLTACDTATDPRYHEASSDSFKLNIPAMQDQYIELAQGSTLEIVAASQPDYGVATACQYSVQVSLTEDFENFFSLASQENTNTRMLINQGDLSLGLCELLGYNGDNADQFDVDYPDGFPYMPVYFRGVCRIYYSNTNADVEGSEVYSANVVAYNHIKPYFGVPVPGVIYMVGEPNGWDINSSPYMLKEANDAIGSKIYSGVFYDITPAALQSGFRFYSELGDWGSDAALPSIGSGPNDYTSVTVELTDGKYEGEAYYGKGNWSISNFPGGALTIILNMSNPSAMSIQFIAGEATVVTPHYMYVMGQLNSEMKWVEPSPDQEDYYNNYRIVDNSESGIYSGKFTVDAGDFYFRFCSELNEDGWDNATQIGAHEEDNDSEDVEFAGGVFQGNYVLGKGSWHVTFTSAGTIDLNVDTNTDSVTFVYTEGE